MDRTALAHRRRTRCTRIGIEGRATSRPDSQNRRHPEAERPRDLARSVEALGRTVTLSKNRNVFQLVSKSDVKRDQLAIRPRMQTQRDKNRPNLSEPDACFAQVPKCRLDIRRFFQKVNTIVSLPVVVDSQASAWLNTSSLPMIASVVSKRNMLNCVNRQKHNRASSSNC